jgi:hypothetical protein
MRILLAGVAGLLLLKMGPAAWTGGEEHYFQLAYRTFAPDKFSRLHAVGLDESIGRFLPLYLMGSTVGLLGYEGAQALWRVLTALLYAASLTYFFAALQLSVWDALLVLVVFLLNDGRLMGREWLFESTEPKTIAYALVFAALGLALRQRQRASMVAAAAATYAHFLVGGFWTLVMMAQRWLETRQWRGLLRSLGLYALLTLPLVAMLARDRFAGTVPVGAPVDSIYAARVPNHVAPFRSTQKFWEWTPGIAPVAALVVVLATIAARRRLEGTPVGIVLRTALLGLAYLILALGAAFLDRHTQVLAKFYLFRPSALAFFLAVTALVALLRERLSEDAAALKGLAILGLVATFAWATLRTQVDTFRFAGAMIPERDELVAAVATITAPGDVVLIEPIQEHDAEYLRLHREISRPTLVSFKFVPTNPPDVLRWGAYLELRRDLFAHGCSSPREVPVRWLVTLRRASVDRVLSCGQPVWRKGNVALIPVPSP